MGRPDTGLLVVADFDTPARAVGLITVQRRHGRPSPAWSGTPGPDLRTAAAAAVVAERTGSSGR